MILTWDAVAALAATATAVGALWLLYLQRRDINQERLRQREAQANALMLDLCTEADSIGDGAGWTLRDCHLTIENTSQKPVRIVGIEALDADRAKEGLYWAPWGLRSRNVSMTHAELYGETTVRPGETRVTHLPAGFFADMHVGGDEFVVITFRDAQGRQWRRRTDTYELEELFSSRRRLPRLRRSVERVMVWTTLYGWFHRLARSSVRRNPDRMPWSLRFVIFATGMAFEGASVDRWMVMPDVPRVRGHSYLFGPPPDAPAEEDERWKEEFQYDDASTWAWKVPDGDLRN